MNSKMKIIIAVVAVIAIAGGALLLANNNSSQQPTDTSSSSGDNSGTTQPTDTNVAATVIYTSSGFSPASVTVASGSKLKIVNQSNDTIRPSSDPHPTHTDNVQLNFTDIEPGQSATVTLTTKGTWGYHNHYQTDRRGTVVVE